jgi:Putative amidase domain
MGQMRALAVAGALAAFGLGAWVPTSLAYSPSGAAAYADDWANACNPYDGICYGDDCTAFVSKALYLGGRLHAGCQ